MHATAPAEDFFDKGRELARAREGQTLALGDDGPRDTARLGLLPVFAEDADQIRLARRVDQEGGRLTGGRIHAHVERPVMAEAESAFGRVELMRGDTEVENRAIVGRAGQNGRNLRGVGKIGLHHAEAVAAGAQLFRGMGQRLIVAVETDHSRSRREQGSSMAAPTQRAVEIDTSRGGLEQRDHLIAQHRLVPVLRVRVCARMIFFGGQIVHRLSAPEAGCRPIPPPGLPRLFSRKNRKRICGRVLPFVWFLLFGG